MNRIALALLCCVPLLSHCASWRFQRQDCAAHPAPLATQLWPQDLRSVHQLQQKGENPRQLLVVVRRDSSRLELQALNPLGMELFRLNWHGGQLHSQGPPAVLESFDMTVLLADFQLVNWPLERLQSAWLGSPWTLQQTDFGRRLSCAGVAVSEVHYPRPESPSRGIVLSNHLAGYTLEILDLNPQPAAAAARP